jgi:hypothetical protein
MISGHHRLRAAMAAGMDHILVYLYDELPEDRVYSKQLAHNQIFGTSDAELIKRVWDRIEDVQAKFEAFVDPRDLDVPDPVSFTQVDVDLDALSKTILVTFLNTQYTDWSAIIEEILPSGDIDEMYLADREGDDAFAAAVGRVREDLDIVSIPTAIAEMTKLVTEALDARRAEQE